MLPLPMRHPFRRKTLSPRLWPVYGLVLLLFWLAQPQPLGLGVGLVLIVAGESLRVWGAGHLVKNDVLTLTGPYAYVRNPLYAGTLLIGVGFALAAGRAACWIVLPAGLTLFFFYYFPYKERIESARLEHFYGAPYTLYRAAVPALVPTLAPWRQPGEGGTASAASWSAARFTGNDESGTLLAVLLGVLALMLRPLLSL